MVTEDRRPDQEADLEKKKPGEEEIETDDSVEVVIERKFNPPKD